MYTSTSLQDYGGGNFTCPAANRTGRPNSVHELIPDDIQIVGAMGASIMVIIFSHNLLKPAYNNALFISRLEWVLAQTVCFHYC